MKLHRLLVVVAVGVLCCGPGWLVAEEPEDQPTARLRFDVSAREIALNQVVSVEFNTLRPQTADMDVMSATASLQAELESPSVREHWRLAATPEIIPRLTNDGERINYLTVVLRLLPRHTGDIELPQIPLRWLRNTPRTDFGVVTVIENVQIGSGTAPLPSEVTSVGGHAWGTSATDLRQSLGSSATFTYHESLQGHVFEPRPGLRLVLRGDRLAEAHLTAPVNLARAQDAFISRWGTPFETDLDAQVPHMTWVLGWVRIHAEQIADQRTRVVLVNEAIESALARSRVQSEVFDLLEGGSTGASLDDDNEPRAMTPEEMEDEAARRVLEPSDADVEDMLRRRGINP